MFHPYTPKTPLVTTTLHTILHTPPSFSLSPTHTISLSLSQIFCTLPPFSSSNFGSNNKEKGKRNQSKVIVIIRVFKGLNKG